jgi:hypothetical protein
MEIEKLKKYLQVYLDDIITPELNRELVGEDDEPITVKVHDIEEKQHISGESVVFLDINPPWNGSILFRINDDIACVMKDGIYIDVPANSKVS